MNKRDIALGLLAGLATTNLIGTAARAGDPVSEEDGRSAIKTWLDAVRSGDPSTVEAVLAPEFQLLRSDGTGHDRTSYLSDLPKQAGQAEISKLFVTSHKDTVVTRYVLEIEQTINGKTVQAIAPRLSVFRRTGTGWQIMAHANFALIGQG